MPWGYAIAAVGTVAAGSQAKKGSEAAADASAGGAREARNLTQQQFETTRNDLRRYRRIGEAANERIYKLLALGGGTPDFDQFYESPGYQFRLEQGNQALERAGSAGGAGFLSGAQIKAAQRFNQGLASQEFDNFYNRLLGLSDRGQNAAVQTGQFGANAASQGAGFIQNAANFLAGGARDQAAIDANTINQLAQLTGNAVGSNRSRESGYGSASNASGYDANNNFGGFA